MKDQPPFFVTWCRAQNAFHTETLDEMLENNLGIYFARQNGPDWIVVGVAKDRQEAYALSKELRRRLERP